MRPLFKRATRESTDVSWVSLKFMTLCLKGHYQDSEETGYRMAGDAYKWACGQGLISTMYYCKDGIELFTHTSTAKWWNYLSKRHPRKNTDASKHMEENVDLWLMGREGGAMWLKCFEVKK